MNELARLSQENRELRDRSSSHELFDGLTFEELTRLLKARSMDDKEAQYLNQSLVSPGVSGQPLGDEVIRDLFDLFDALHPYLATSVEAKNQTATDVMDVFASFGLVSHSG